MCMAGGAIPAMAADPADAVRGQLLYENHCRFCHTPTIHARPRSSPLTRSELSAIVAHWSRQQQLNWSEQDTRDVVEYLQRTRYRGGSSVEPRASLPR